MSQLFDNTNYFEALSPTGRNIQGVVPVKKYYVMQQPFKQPINSIVLSIPIVYRESINDHSNQIIYINVIRTGGGVLQPFIYNATESDLSYITILKQQFNNTVQDRQYLQRDSSYTKVSKDNYSANSFMTLQSFGTSTDNSNGGNDTGDFNLNIQIDNHDLNIIGHWYTPFVKDITSQNNDALNGWLTLECVDDYINLV